MNPRDFKGQRGLNSERFGWCCRDGSVGSKISPRRLAEHMPHKEAYIFKDVRGRQNSSTVGTRDERTVAVWYVVSPTSVEGRPGDINRGSQGKSSVFIYYGGWFKNTSKVRCSKYTLMCLALCNVARWLNKRVAENAATHKVAIDDVRYKSEAVADHLECNGGSALSRFSCVLSCISLLSRLPKEHSAEHTDTVTQLRTFFEKWWKVAESALTTALL